MHQRTAQAERNNSLCSYHHCRHMEAANRVMTDLIGKHAWQEKSCELNVGDGGLARTS